MFEYWSLFTLTFLCFAGIGSVIYLLGNRKSRFEEKKYETYTCGEPFPEVRISPENFYISLKTGLGIREVREAHTGRISDYLLWFLIGLVIVIFMVLTI